MKHAVLSWMTATLICLSAPLVLAAGAQVMDKPGFKALPRPFTHATPLASKAGPKAVIVYGKNAPWTLTAATAVQKAVADWSGATLELVDDRTVTADATWLLTDAYFRTPMIVIGNAQDNRLVHAVGTRYLSQSSRTWPGGDRYTIRTLFEPFVADVNYIMIEASTEAGGNAAAAKFAELTKAFPKDAQATVSRTRVIGAGKDQWESQAANWKPSKEWFPTTEGSVSDLLKVYRGPAITAGDSLSKAGATADIVTHTIGGWAGTKDRYVTVTMDAPTMRTIAAMYTQGVRAAGDRTHVPLDHYGAMSTIVGLRCLFQQDLLSEKEFNELESAMVLSGAYPNEYWYDHIGAGDGWLNEVGVRHGTACLLVTANTLDYVLNHCRLDDRTRKEITRRYEGMRKTLADFDNTFRENNDTFELGESTMMILYTQLHQGMLEVVRTGNLRRMADMYIATTDNMIVPNQWRIRGCYAGLDDYIGAGPGMMMGYWHGQGMVSTAAFFYDDPQYRFFMARESVGGPWGSVACSPMTVHWDTVGKSEVPSRHLGVLAIPYDARIYNLHLTRNKDNRWAIKDPYLVPGPAEKSVDRVAFRDGFEPKDAYLFLATSQNECQPLQNNAIAKYTDLGEVWLYHNTMFHTTWARNVVSISNGQPYRPRGGCTLEGLVNTGEFSAVSTKESDVSGSHYARTIVHLRGHYFVVLDRVEAAADGEFNTVCRWRTPQPAVLKADGTYVADAPSGSRMTIQCTEPLRQTAELWEADGSGRPHVLSQFKSAKLKKGETISYQNLIYVSGKDRPDEFQAKRISDNAILVKGKTAAGEHFALIGSGGAIPLGGIETDAVAYIATGDTLYLLGASGVSVDAVMGGPKPDVQFGGRFNVLLDGKTGKYRLGNLWAPDKAPTFGPEEKAALPKMGFAEQLTRLWNITKGPAVSTQQIKPEGDIFKVVAADKPLLVPKRRVTGMQVTANITPGQPISQLTDGMYFGQLPGNTPTWASAENLEITLTFPEPTEVSCIRPVGILAKAPAYGFGAENFGKKFYQEGDFKFTLVLSDDGFKNDLRKIDSPKVGFEETYFYPNFHSGLGRLPTWRIEVGAKAKQIRLVPRATTKARPEFSLAELEAYGAPPADDLGVKALAADIDGDGGNELYVGTSNKELAAYNADGRQLWQKRYDGDIFTLGVGDLDNDGKQQALVYLTTEQFRRVNGDGSERAVADVHAAMVREHKVANCGGVMSMLAWQPQKGKPKEVHLWSEGNFRVQPDASVSMGKIPMSRAAGRLVDLYPGEPEVLANITGYGAVILWSARKDGKQEYIQLGSKPLAGPAGAPYMRSFGYVRQVTVGDFKGFVAAHDGGLNWFPIADFAPGAADTGWGLSTAGASILAMEVEDTVPGPVRVLVARQDGFVNVLNLADGKPLGQINAGGPVLGLALLGDKPENRRIAVGTKFAVQVFHMDLKKLGSYPLPAAAFAGPGGKQKDRVYVADSAGKVTVLVIR